MEFCQAVKSFLPTETQRSFKKGKYILILHAYNILHTINHDLDTNV